MALYHLSIKYFSRRRGQSILAAAAYRSGERLYDRYYGLTHDFTDKRGIVHTNILLPASAPKEFYNRENLWNAVEQSEIRKDSRLAREVEVSLPVELNLSEQIQLVENYIKINFVDRGMCADICLHDKGIGNPHAHILLTTRDVSENGFGLKNREWDKREYVNQWRGEWAKLQNRELERMGLETRVHHESYIARNIKHEPTLHLGHRVMEYERNNLETDRGNENRAIIERNIKSEELQHQRQQKRERNRERNRSRGR